jgi:cobalt-zinc-cadmium efflux system membrane fusion protein
MSEDKKDINAPETAYQPSVAERVDEVETHTARSGRKRALVIAIAAITIIAVSGVVWLLRRKADSGAGKPVPAPRTVSITETKDQQTKSTGSGEPTVTLTHEQAERAGIKIEPVGEQTVSEAAGQQSTGVVQANAYRETPVISLVGGIVRSVRAELGQTVRKGQNVALISSSELADAQSRYLAAFADLDEHHKHHQRTANLVEIGAASKEEFEEATKKLKSDEAAVANMRQRLQILGLSPQRVNALRSSSQVSSDVDIPSPVAGTVTSRAVNPGEIAEANKELMKVTDLSSVWVVGQVYEKDLARVRVGSGATINSDAYPGRVFRGKVTYVDPALDQATRTGQVRVEIPNPRQMLKIGMYVNIAFATAGGAESTVPIVPNAAVQNINNQQVVFLATGDPNIFIMRPVRLGPESNGYLPVQEGLHVGDRVVTNGSFLLRAEWLKTHPGQ